MLLIDPPTGWAYGFPRKFDKPDHQSLEDWLMEKGYPLELIQQGMATYCRYIGPIEELRKLPHLRYSFGSLDEETSDED
jgi:hypothetical protein